MMSKWCCFLTALLIQVAVVAQSSSYLDSLRRLQMHGVTDSIKARASFLIGDHMYTDFEKAKPELDKGLALSKGNTFLTGLYHFYLGGLYFYQQPEKAIAAYDKTVSLLQHIKTTESLEFQARSWHNIGAQHHYTGDPKLFMEILIQHSIPLATEAKSDKLLANYDYVVGMLLMNNKDYQAADEYYKKSLAYYRNTVNADELDHLEVLDGTARNFLYWDKGDSTKHYLDKALPLANKYKNEMLYLSVKETEANYYNVLKNYARAETILKETIQASGHFKGTQALNALYFQLYKSLSKQGKYREAKVILEQAKDYMQMTPGNRLMYLSNMSELHEWMNDYPAAYEWLKEAYLLRDTMYNDGYRNEMRAMEKKYQTVEKEKEIARLQAEKKETQLAQKNQLLLNWLLGIGAAIFLLAFIFAVYIYRNRQQKTLSQLQEVERQKELDLTKAILDGEERERRRMARDLHDGLGGMLAGVKIKLSAVSGTRQSQQPELDLAIGQLDHSVSELRRIARNMMPESLVRFGLDTALKDLCESLMNDHTRISYESYNVDNNIDMNVQIVIYRIIQEALSNALRHAEARQVLLQCSQNEKTFLITVEDDGKGFDLSVMTGHKGIGLNNIESRVNYLRGKTDIISSPGEGTAVNIEVCV